MGAESRARWFVNHELTNWGWIGVLLSALAGIAAFLVATHYGLIGWNVLCIVILFAVSVTLWFWDRLAR